MRRSFVEWALCFVSSQADSTSFYLNQQLAGQEGVIPVLLQIIASDSVDMYVNLSHVFACRIVRC